MTGLLAGVTTEHPLGSLKRHAGGFFVHERARPGSADLIWSSGRAQWPVVSSRMCEALGPQQR